MTDIPDTLAACAVAVLTTAEARAKADLSRACAAEWMRRREAGDAMPPGHAAPPDSPARPARPDLLAPPDVPRRGPGSAEGRIALIHAIAHIELNAVDLHWDVIARYTATPIPAGFCDDWVRAADEEANPAGGLARGAGQPLRRPARPCRHVAGRRGYGG